MQFEDKKILLLCENENAAQIDRRALREAGVSSVKIMRSGVDAAKLIARMEPAPDAFYPDAIVCTQALEDMDGEQFCAIIRQHPKLLAFPVLLILPSENESEQLKTLGCGASALLGRPYTIDKLSQILALLFKAQPSRKQLELGARQTDTSAFDSALATYGILLRPSRQPDDYFRVGMRCLKEKRWNYAINAFQLALSEAQIKAEAELGMACAFKGKGDMRRFKAWLARAAETLVQARQWHLARTAYAKLLNHDPDAKNPFLTRAHQLIRLKNYQEAAITLVESLSILKEAKTGDKFARICFTAEDPEAMFQALEASLSKDQNTAPLSEEIKNSLTSLVRDREDRKRQMAVERKWQLAQKLAQAPKPAPVKSETSPSTVADFAAETEEPAEEEDVDNVLDPLTENEATSDMFAKKPKLNELLSVMKLTWKLARRSEKKS